MTRDLARGDRVVLRRPPHWTGTVVARREGNVDVQWDQDGCVTTRRLFELRRPDVEVTPDDL